MKLANWLDLPNNDGSKKNRAAFAERIGVTPQMISAYCSDRILPSKKTLEGIARETSGMVTPNDFIEMPAEAAQ